MFTLHHEASQDSPAIEALLDRVFGTERRAKRSYDYRQGIAPLASLGMVARDAASAVIGTIRYWPLLVHGDDGDLPALLLGPLAVDPAYQRRGIGEALLLESLARAVSRGHRLVLLVGAPDYYTRYGFRPAAPLGFTMQGEDPARLMVLALDAAGSTLLGGELRAARRDAAVDDAFLPSQERRRA
jgi:predicted N-acetyltransferase YhbS